jgi:hypothetical protein
MTPVEEIVATEMGESAPILGGAVPLPLPEAGKKAKLCLRCFAYKVRDGLYRAECIDLDIGTESESLQGAIRGLGDAIYGYLMVVFEDVKTNEEMPAAVLRPSPLSHRLQYYLGYLVNKIGSFFRRDDNSKRKFYRTPYGLSTAHYCS